MTDAEFVALLGAGLAGVVAMVLWLRPTFRRLEARREEVGPREIPRPALVRFFVLWAAGFAVGFAAMAIGDYRLVPTLGGMLIVFLAMGGSLRLLLSDAEKAQRRDGRR